MSFTDFLGWVCLWGFPAVKGRVEEGSCRTKSFGNPDEEVVRGSLLRCRLRTSWSAGDGLALGRV